MWDIVKGGGKKPHIMLHEVITSFTYIVIIFCSLLHCMWNLEFRDTLSFPAELFNGFLQISKTFYIPRKFNSVLNLINSVNDTSAVSEQTEFSSAISLNNYNGFLANYFEF